MDKLEKPEENKVLFTTRRRVLRIFAGNLMKPFQKWT